MKAMLIVYSSLGRRAWRTGLVKRKLYTDTFVLSALANFLSLQSWDPDKLILKMW